MKALTKKFLLASLLACVVAECVAETRPNIVVILADDMGYADAGFNGATDIRTPNLDRLAESGVVFTSGYCNHPFCGPSRAALLAGRYQHRFGFEHNPHYDPGNPHLGIDPNEKLFPARLQEVGYTTGGVGKWHLGAAAPFNPLNRGFNYFYGFLGGGHDYFRIDLSAPLDTAYLTGLVRNNKPAGFEGYLTTALSRDAVEFIERHCGEPFFLYVAYNAPHSPLQAPAETIAKYGHIVDEKRRVYAAMVDEMDRGVGMVIDSLERTHVRDNTLVFFLSDNGGPQPMSWNPNYGNSSSNAPLRGGKTNLYDGGIRVPFVASWPVGLPAGKKFDQPVIALDIARTAVELAGGDADSEPALEGVNLAPFLRGESLGKPHDLLYWRDLGGARWAILTGEGTKCVVDDPRRAPEVYHLPNDIGETTDRSSEVGHEVARLRACWRTWDAANTGNRIVPAHDYQRLQADFFQSTATASEADWHSERESNSRH
ncbi:sulfatase family protein [Botrimarina hoheduenensis]|uniref:Arylsulfatase n=1 Tax=Botrimarina hoheduenensis TaxID=2528000 RepID=A0A5C5VT16_9BACT|nr:sulfatase-like hydrolase/transferase [Botrimarina hoheduenensis]TWT40682.1 Arylsulfatase precursor [Botrimarina hoheduenensis]